MNLNHLVETLKMENWMDNENADIRTVADLIDFCLALDESDIEFLESAVMEAKESKQ